MFFSTLHFVVSRVYDDMDIIRGDVSGVVAKSVGSNHQPPSKLNVGAMPKLHLYNHLHHHHHQPIPHHILQNNHPFQIPLQITNLPNPIMTFTTDATIASSGGRILKLTHQSTTTSTPMKLNLFLPPTASPTNPSPVLIYLSGLTCTPDNVTEKAFLQAHASPLNLALLYPDTSPRGTNFPGEHDAYDFGSAASFYIDAQKDPWSTNYKMESYLTTELPDLLFSHFKELDSTRVSITGHSMGGHGALTLFLKHPTKYKSVSAFAPICNPTQCPWGEKAFTGYLGDDKAEWAKHDATELVKSFKGDLNCLIDVVCFTFLLTNRFMMIWEGRANKYKGHG